MGETNVQTANAEQLSNVKTGYVKVDQVALHTKDNTNSSSIDTIRFNTKVNILETTNDWYKVSVNNKVGYVQKDSILLKNKLQSNNQYIVNANALNVRSEPNLEASILDV
ncbi:SH3 domain-containing protein, partial [Bacillus sp. D-CC]